MLSTRKLRVAAGLAVSALVAVVAVSTGTSATSQSAKIVIWADADRYQRSRRSPTPGRPARASPSRSSRSSSARFATEVSTVAVDTAPDVIVGAHDWIGELSGNGSIIPLSPSAATKSSSRVRAQRVLVRDRRSRSSTALPSLSRTRSDHEHEARKVPKSFAASRSRPSRSRRRRSLRSASPSGRAHGRRVPHVPVLLRPRRLRLRHEQGRQPRPVGHRRREPEVPEERPADRQVEQGRPHPLAGPTASRRTSS